MRRPIKPQKKALQPRMVSSMIRGSSCDSAHNSQLDLSYKRSISNRSFQRKRKNRSQKVSLENSSKVLQEIPLNNNIKGLIKAIKVNAKPFGKTHMTQSTVLSPSGLPKMQLSPEHVRSPSAQKENIVQLIAKSCSISDFKSSMLNQTISFS